MKKAELNVEKVLGQGPFVEVGDPTAIDVSTSLIVVGGDLGWPQWNGRDVGSRSSREAGWFPIGIYSRDTLACLKTLTSRWEINGIAIHPSEQFIAVGTGRYDGGYSFDGELLLHDMTSGRTTSLLESYRSVEHPTWRDEETLEIVLAPPTDEYIDDWAAIEHEHLELASTNWQLLERQSIALAGVPKVHQLARVPDRDAVRRTMADHAAAHGSRWELRRQVWALASAPGGLVAGRESSIERWGDRDGTVPVWRHDVDGTCTQFFTYADHAVATLWAAPRERFHDRATQVWSVDLESGKGHVIADPGFPAVLSRRSDGQLLVRPSTRGRSEPPPAVVITDSGAVVGQVSSLGSYDLINHYFDIRRCPEILVLVGEEPRSWEHKHVAEARLTQRGWRVQRLFPFDWDGTRHLFGGPGVFLSAPEGPSIVHAGAIHDGAGLLRGNAFVVRRRYPDGELAWHLPLDNTVVSIDEADGVVVALTNLGEAFGIDATTGVLRWQADLLHVGGNAVVPLSLVLDSSARAWIGTMDGRILQVALPAS